MGAFLSEPVTDKDPCDEESEFFSYGSNSMQGWRVTQEDAHNCILKFDDEVSLFAVYDGHGGPEVAQYCARYLPNFIKNTDSYKSQKFTEALIDSYLGFDEILTEPNALEELKQIANRKIDSDSDDDNEYSELIEEAHMPLEKLLKKYQASKLNKETTDDEEDVTPGPSGSAQSSCGKVSCPESPDAENESSEGKDIKCEADAPKPEDIKSDSSTNSVVKLCNGIEAAAVASDSKEKEESVKGKSLKVSEKRAASTRLMKKTLSIIARQCQKMDQEMNNMESNDSEESDDSDEDFNEDSDNSESSNTEECEANDLEDEESDECEEEECEEEEEEEEEGNVLDASLLSERQEALRIQKFQSALKSEPGCDSGCTAVVALIHGTDLYVANAGDSRCVLCRNGEAIEMSFDHKPEDEEETKRIVKAGGMVTRDGRVNGGLNLSRAIGDHGYKSNLDLSLKEQMISALPDVKTIKLSDYDEFIVLACDGIWNSMSSQDVVNFVRDRLLKHKVKGRKISDICGELFDQCLAPNTSGDGTGCDNMTAIIIQIKKLPSSKRQADDTTELSKRVKINDV